MAVLYYHPNGDDSLTGATPALARKSLNRLLSGPGATANASDRFYAGDTILLARGGIWTPPADVLNARYMIDLYANVHNGQYIGSYTADLGDDQPILDPLLYDDGAGWATTAYPGVWTKTYSASQTIGLDFRCWPALTGPTSPRNYDAFKLMASAALCVAVSQFYVSGSQAWVYSGATSPFVFYGGLAFTHRVFGGGPTLGRYRHIDGEDWLDGVTLRGALANQTGCLNARLDQLRFENVSGPGLSFTDQTSLVQNIIISRPTVDYHTGANENVGLSTGGSAGFGGWDALKFGGNYASSALGVYDVDIIDANIRGARHACIGAYNTGTVNLDCVKGITMRSSKIGRSVMECGEIDYGRFAGIVTSGTVIDGIVINGVCTMTQLTGIATLRNCQFLGMRPQATTNDNYGADSCISASDPAGTTPSTNILVENNFIENPKNFAFVVNVNPTTIDSTVAGDFKFYNNTVVDLTYYNQKRVYGSYDAAMPDASCLFYAQSSMAMFAPDLRNNAFIRPDGATTVYLVNNISGGANPSPVGDNRWRTDSYTLNDPTMPGVVPIANQQYASLVSSGAGPKGEVMPGSPMLGAGSLISVTKRDARGFQRLNPPAVGCTDVLTHRRRLDSDPAGW